jgi:UDPglucose--hexose-1-phosphate uridylyltransferase
MPDGRDTPELRQDPISGCWTIIAPRRAERPSDYSVEPPIPQAAEKCPFCAGHESATPFETLVIGSEGSSAKAGGWRVRVVPNLYPMLELSAASALQLDPLGASAPGRIPQVRQAGRGAHEVIIESPRHLTRMAELTPAELCDVVWAYRERLAYWQENSDLVYGLVFKNVGAAAGASLEHVHSQLLVTPLVPSGIERELSGARELWKSTGCCPYCRLIEDELRAGARVVLDTSQFLAFCPFASRFPFETWILPKVHANHFQRTERGPISQLAELLHRILSRVELLPPCCAYNFALHTTPFDTRAVAYYHWHLEIMPRILGVAGLELGAGCYTNPVPPERAAEILRRELN